MTHLERQLARNIAERDAEFAEALLDPQPVMTGDWPDALERPVFPREHPPGFIKSLVDSWVPIYKAKIGAEVEGAAEAEARFRRRVDAACSRSQRQPTIQDGQRLAQVAALIAERLMDHNWVQLRMDSSAHATDLIEIAAALKEFGA